MKTFLIIQTAFIGDVILATPVLEKLRRHFPDAAIDILVRKGNEALLDGHPHLRRVLIRDKRLPKWKQWWTLTKQIRKEKYDYVINLQRFAFTGWLTAVSGANKRIGFDKNPFSFAFTHQIKHEIGKGKHEVERNLELLECFTDKEFEMPKLYPKEEHFQKVESFKKQPYICIAPTSVWYTKQFPPQKWEEFIKKLQGEVRVYLLGAPSDFEACQDIARKSYKVEVQNLSGQLSLLESAALMQDAKMNYVNDSAPLHLASAMNAPVVAVFCSTLPQFGFTPLSTKRKIVQTQQEMPCRPCGLHGKKTCKLGTFACATTINVEELKMVLD